MFTKNIAAFCIVVVLFYQSIAFAEGKMRVIVPPVQEPQSSELLDCYLSPNWGSSETEMKDEPIIVSTHTEKEISKSNPINAIKLQNGNVTISLPEPQTTSELKPAKLFASPTLRALITWNGKSDENGEEIMIVSSDEISKTGFEEAVVGIIPLPGKPLDIKRVDDKIFEKIQLLLHRKYDHKGEAVIYGQIPQYPVIADYSIIIAKFENIDHFADDVNSYIQIQYDKERINIEVQPEELNVIKKYWDKGFRYFAFDLSLLLNKVSRKSPILFRFKSSYAYYPLAINTIGGTGRGYIDLIVMTPETIRLTKDFEQEAKTKETTIRVVGNKSVNVTKDELQTLDPDLSQFWSGDENDSITVRRFVFAIKDIGDFDADFAATQTEKQKNVIDSEQTAVFPENSQLLFVFGTNEKDVLPVVQTSKQQIKSLLKITGTTDKNFKILEGTDATPDNILKVCEQLNKQVNKDGAILVYVISRDVETKNGQILYPLAKSATDLGQGLLWNDIFKTITKNEHRLCILITDGCLRPDVQCFGGEASSDTVDPIYRFVALMSYGKGQFHIRAASPEKKEVPLGTHEKGTFFTNTFVNLLDAHVENTGQFDIPALIKELQQEINIIYEDVKIKDNNQKGQTIRFLLIENIANESN